jgi:hypothetical protein
MSSLSYPCRVAEAGTANGAGQAKNIPSVEGCRRIALSLENHFCTIGMMAGLPELQQDGQTAKNQPMSFVSMTGWWIQLYGTEK